MVFKILDPDCEHDFWKVGFLRGVQRYTCKLCGMNTAQLNRPRFKWHTREVILAAITMRDVGDSYQKIATQINKMYGTKVGIGTVWRWVKEANEGKLDYDYAP